MPGVSDAAFRRLPFVLCAVVLARPATAQCRPGPHSNEARLLALYSTPLAFAADGAAISDTARGIRITAEAALVPRAPAALRTTNRCYVSRTQNTALAPAIARPRLAILLPAGVGLELSYVPPVTVFDATPDLIGAALWISRAAGPHVRVTLRAHATAGNVAGPVTCPRSALQQSDPGAPCYGTRPSHDEFHPGIRALEGIATLTPAAWRRASVQLGAGVTSLAPRFQVSFTDGTGHTDRTEVLVNLTRVALFGGATLALTPRCSGSTQIYGTAGDGATARIMLGCALRAK